MNIKISFKEKHKIMATIVFKEIPKLNINENYWYSDIKTNKVYNVIDSYEKYFNNSSKHFFLIQDDDGQLMEIPLTSYFIYSK